MLLDGSLLPKKLTTTKGGIQLAGRLMVGTDFTNDYFKLMESPRCGRYEVALSHELVSETVCIVCIVIYDLLVMVLRAFKSCYRKYKFHDETSNHPSQSGHLKNPISQSVQSQSKRRPLPCPCPPKFPTLSSITATAEQLSRVSSHYSSRFDRTRYYMRSILFYQSYLISIIVNCSLFSVFPSTKYGRMLSPSSPPTNQGTTSTNPMQ